MFGPVRYLGIEIEERYLSLVELGKAGDGYQVLNATRVALPEEATPRDIARTLSRFLGETGISAARIALSLPAHQCALKFAQLPPAKGAEQERMVQYEAMSQIPLPLTEMVWDYRGSASSFSPMCQTLIAAARRAPVAELLDALAEEGIRPKIVDISLLAGVRAVADMDFAEEPYLLVQIGEEWADIALAEDDRVYASRSFRAGLRDLAQAIAGTGKMTYEDVVANLTMRGIPSELDGGDGASAVEAWFDRLGQHIRQTADTFVGDDIDRPRRVVLVGGIGLAPGCAEALSRRCGLPVEIGDPWLGMRVDAPSRQAASERPAAFAVATGLALAGLQRVSGINLLPRLHAEVTVQRRKSAAVIAGLSLAVLALLGAYYVTNNSLTATRHQLREVKAKVAEVRREARGRVVRPAADAAEVRATVRAIREPRRQPLELLRRISAGFPRDIVLTEFSYQNDKAVMLKGSAVSSAVVADAVAALNAMKTFDNIRLDFVNARKDGSKGYDFQMTCAFTVAEKTRKVSRQ